MTEEEKLIRAREACAAEWPEDAESYRSRNSDKSWAMRAALRVLNDLDKPIPDPDEAWRPFLEALRIWRYGTSLTDDARLMIARIKAALYLMPPEEK